MKEQGWGFKEWGQRIGEAEDRTGRFSAVYWGFYQRRERTRV